MHWLLVAHRLSKRARGSDNEDVSTENAIAMTKDLDVNKFCSEDDEYYLAILLTSRRYSVFKNKKKN